MRQWSRCRCYFADVQMLSKLKSPLRAGFFGFRLIKRVFAQTCLPIFIVATLGVFTPVAFNEQVPDVPFDIGLE